MTELCELSAAKATQVEHWCRLGIIVPQEDAQGRGSYRVFSTQNVIEAAMARHLAEVGMSGKQLQVLFGKLRERLAELSPELRVHAAFVRYVETVNGLVAITGPGPNYQQWRADVERTSEACQAVLRGRRKQGPRDDHILQLVAARASTQKPEKAGSKSMTP